MKFSDFIEKGLVKHALLDISLVKSLVATAEDDLKFLSSLPINDNSARKLMSNYYDILRSILEAITALDGYKVYSHEAFTFYLKEKGENAVAEKFDRFRKIRNGINYYGKSISADETRENIAEMAKLITLLKMKYLSDMA
jgi:hypothetical protein